MQWKNNELSTATIKSLSGGRCIVRTNVPVTVMGVKAISQKTANGFVTAFDTEKGKGYQVTIKLPAAH